MQKNKRTELIKENQGYTLMQDAAATAPDRTLPFVVMEALYIGKENAISAQELCDCLGFNSTRDLQHEISRERKAGAVILSTCQEGGGYFLPGNDREVRQFIKTLENRANNTFEALCSARRYLRQQESSHDK
nr:MAG TPA: Mga helix-turn-helix domain [Caudoviricetes sp.]